MIIVNADDFGRSYAETNAALACYKENRITSATAMVFMEDSERAAGLANEAGIDVGMHLNLSQEFTAPPERGRLQEYHRRIVRFLTSSRYSLLLYNPALRRQFRYVYEAQLEEFKRLYGRQPSHIDGHQHKHLCTNMLVGGIIPAQEKVRRNFSFRPGDKNFLNRFYRKLVDRALMRRYGLTDFFFSLEQCLQQDRLARVFALAMKASVELMCHPCKPIEYTYLMSEPYWSALQPLQKGTYASLMPCFATRTASNPQIGLARSKNDRRQDGSRTYPL